MSRGLRFALCIAFILAHCTSATNDGGNATASPPLAATGSPPTSSGSSGMQTFEGPLQGQALADALGITNTSSPSQSDAVGAKQLNGTEQGSLQTQSIALPAGEQPCGLL